jgi:hypothetical protein
MDNSNMDNVLLELLTKIKTITPHYMNGDDKKKNLKYHKDYMTYNHPYN